MRKTEAERFRADVERFWAKVYVQRYPSEGSCWLWTAYRQPNGYGRFAVGYRMVQAHRWSWESVNGPIPDGLQLDHLCRNRACVNPTHLELVTQRENIMRGVGCTARESRKTHCKNGHAFTFENTYRRKNGGRRCRTCQREAERRHKTLAALAGEDDGPPKPQREGDYL